MRERVDAIPRCHDHPISPESGVLLGVDEGSGSLEVAVSCGALSSCIHFIVHLAIQPCINVGPVRRHKVGEVDLSIK